MLSDIENRGGSVQLQMNKSDLHVFNSCLEINFYVIILFLRFDKPHFYSFEISSLTLIYGTKEVLLVLYCLFVR